MANSITKTGGAAKKRDERRPAEKVGGLSLPATVEQPSLRPLPRIPETAEETAARTRSLPSSAARGPSAAAAETSSAPAQGQSRDLSFHMPGEDPDAKLRYESALAELEALRDAAPRYDSRYDEQIRSLYEQLTSRGPFRYDSATDPLYQQYRQSYVQLGQNAMRDTMGQAAGLTGGYGSSYAQSVGQQQYDAYLRRLADVLPETYGMALQSWQAEGQDLQRRYSAAAALEQSDYERYLDELAQYNRSLDRARSDLDTAYERQFAEDERAYRRAVDDYKRRLDEEERAQSAAASSGSTTRIVIRDKSKDSGSGSKKSSSGSSKGSGSKKSSSGTGKSSGNLNKRSTK